MSISSTYGINLALVNSLISQQDTLAQLTQQTATNQQHSNLTDYSPISATTILSSNSVITQRQSYLSSIQAVQTRLSVYDTVMTDTENVASQGIGLANNNQTYNAKTVDSISQQATTYLKQLTDDLNQKVGGRYIFAGARYNTKPVADLASMTDTPPTSAVSSPALPDYDTDYGFTSSVSVNKTPTGNYVIGNVSIPWSQIASGNVTSVMVGSTPTSVTVTGLSTGGTTTNLASNLAATLTQIASTVGLTGITATSSGTTANVSSTTARTVTPDSGGLSGETTWASGTPSDGTATKTAATNASASTQDTVLVDAGYSVPYGISSTDPSFQNVINGLRNIIAACTAGKSGDTATYQSDMVTAATLMASGLAGVQSLHSQNANNQNLLTTETSTQNADITTLQNQLSDIQSVNLAQVGSEINLFQTQLQASYSATSSLEHLSLVKYL